MPEIALHGEEVPLPPDTPELPDDLTIIARLIDANCRAYSEKYGYHLDSRCLTHYNEGIVRLAQADLITLIPPSEPAGAVVNGLYEDERENGVPAESVRVRATYGAPKTRVARPTQDPIWKLRQEELAKVRAENQMLRAQKGLTPMGVPLWEQDAPTP